MAITGQMRTTVRIVPLLLILLWTGWVEAESVTYKYVGSTFRADEINGTPGIFTTDDRVIASFTLDCAKAHSAGTCLNLPYQNYWALGAVDPSLVEFTAGPARLPTDMGFVNVQRFSFSTDATGQIDQWDLDLFWPDPSGVINVDTDTVLDSAAVLGGGATAFGRPGSWGTSSPVFDEEKILLRLGEPVHGQTHSGVGNLRGWAIAEFGIDRVEIHIDGKYLYDAPYGGSRGDVGAKYPDVPGSDASGFSLAFNYANLGFGSHSIIARAFDKAGEWRDVSATFDVVTFDEAFIGRDAEVDAGDAQITAEGDEITIRNIFIADRLYDLVLKWRTQEQGFEIVEIR